MTNYEIFLRTVDTLKSSQGFYSHLNAELMEMTKEAKELFKNKLNSLSQWKDDVDCILWLEG